MPVGGPVEHFFLLAVGLSVIDDRGATVYLVGLVWYLMQFKKPVVEDLVINMVDVGEETGELDVMLYKVADYYEEEVRTLTDGMMKMIEPMMIIFLGGVVLFIVASLFMPLIAIISGLTQNKG